MMIFRFSFRFHRLDSGELFEKPHFWNIFKIPKAHILDQLISFLASVANNSLKLWDPQFQPVDIIYNILYSSCHKFSSI